MPAGRTYTPIETTTLNTASSTVTFSSISGSYTDLVLISSYRTTSNNITTFLQFNGDTTSKYSETYLQGNGSAASSGRDTAIPQGFAIGYSTSSADRPFISITNLMNYSNTTTYKTGITRANDAGSLVLAYVALWQSTSAINSILISPVTGNFASGSTFTLYGIAAA